MFDLPKETEAMVWSLVNPLWLGEGGLHRQPLWSEGFASPTVCCSLCVRLPQWGSLCPLHGTRCGSIPQSILSSTQFEFESASGCTPPAFLFLFCTTYVQQGLTPVQAPCCGDHINIPGLSGHEVYQPHSLNHSSPLLPPPSS